MKAPSIFAASSLFVIAVFALGVASAGKQDFELVNDTGVEIHELYVAPSKSDDWEEDVLGVDTLPDGESIEITFSRKQKGKLWDLRVVDEEGTSIDWDGLDLSEISKVTLHLEKGKAWADLE